jgi:hypothetical protein
VIYPGYLPLTIEARAAFDRNFKLKAADDATPIDLTSYSLSAAVWTAKGRKLLDFTFAWIDQALGEFSLSLTQAQTATLSGEGLWDLRSENPDGTVDYLLRGPITIEQGYTR